MVRRIFIAYFPYQRHAFVSACACLCWKVENGMYVVRTRTSTYTFFGAFVYIHNWHIAAFAGNVIYQWFSNYTWSFDWHILNTIFDAFKSLTCVLFLFSNPGIKFVFRYKVETAIMSELPYSQLYNHIWQQYMIEVMSILWLCQR